MRVTRETLYKNAQDLVARRARESHDLLAAYLCGSFLEDDFFLGGSADIDLVFVRADAFEVDREVIRLTDEVHLDIAHQSQRDYREARRLRVHPWLGPAVNTCKALYDPQHFLDFTQASVRGQFERADNVFERARQQAEQARRIWMEFQAGTIRAGSDQAGPQETSSYLRAVGQAANAIASLSGPPLTERRFLLNFPERAEAAGRSGLYAGLLGLLGAHTLASNSLADWLLQWQMAFVTVPPGLAPARLHPDRQLYYLRAFEALLSSLRPETVLWPLLRTWTLAACLLPPNTPIVETWRKYFNGLGLAGEGLAERLQALDAYLDLVDETLEAWARLNGV